MVSRTEFGLIWTDFELILGYLWVSLSFLAAFRPIWATFNFFGRKLRVGVPELQIDMKSRVAGTTNRHEKVGHKRGTLPMTSQWECRALPGTSLVCQQTASNVALAMWALVEY